jgi:hypothetical protein
VHPEHHFIGIMRQSVLNSTAMENLMSLQHPRLVRRSPLATATQRPPRPEKAMPTRAAASVLMKLWVEPKSSSVSRQEPLMSTWNCMVRQCHGWMSVSMNRNGGLGGVRRRILGVVIKHLDGEDLLVDYLVNISEEFIIAEAFTIFLSLRNFGPGEPDGTRRWFVDQDRC